MTISADQPASPVDGSAFVVPAERIESRIYLIRGEKVILDADLAELYGVAVKALNQAVRRNRERFPRDFMFQLTHEEFVNLRSQTVTSSVNHGGRRHLPLVFTEQGVAMLSGLLNSPRAIAVNVAIMRTFVRLRQLIASHSDLARKLTELESRYDEQFKAVFDAIRELMSPVPPRRAREMGFHTGIPELRPSRRKKKKTSTIH